MVVIVLWTKPPSAPPVQERDAKPDASSANAGGKKEEMEW